MKDIELHPAPDVAPVLRSMKVDPGVHPAADEEIAAELEVLVFAGGAEPRRVAGAFVSYNCSLVHIEGGLRPVLHRPTVEGSPVEQSGEARFVFGLRKEHGGGGSGSQKRPAIHASIVLGSAFQSPNMTEDVVNGAGYFRHADTQTQHRNRRRREPGRGTRNRPRAR